MTKVILCFRRLRSIVVHRKFIDVGVAFAAQKIRHRLVVHAVSAVELNTKGYLLTSIDCMVERTAQCKYILIIVTTFLIVESISANGVLLTIHKVHLVPIYLTCSFTARPAVVEQLPLLIEEGFFVYIMLHTLLRAAAVFPHVAHTRRKVLVVVWAWVGSIAIPA